MQRFGEGPLVKKTNDESIVHYADMFTALGSEARLRIVRLLLTAHPEGLVVGEIQSALEIPRRRSPIIWNSSNTEALSRSRGKAHSFDTPRMRKRCRISLRSSSSNAARAARQ